MEYWHVMFAQREIVDCDGLMSECFYAGVQSMRSMDAVTKAELAMLFPELASDGFGAIAAPVSRSFEAKACGAAIAAKAA